MLPTFDPAAAADLLPAAAALGAGLIAGVFFAFANFVLRALAELPAPAGLAAMQTINRTVLNPAFLGVFVGTAALGIAAAVCCWPGAGRWPAVVGAAAYGIGTLLVTGRANVPRNEALAPLDPTAAASVAPWRRYVREWSRWNHVRTAAAAVAAAAFTIAAAA